MRKRVFAIVVGSAVLSVAALSASRSIKRAEEMFRRKEYDRARKETAADTSSMNPVDLADALLLLARIETDYAKAEQLFRRVAASENGRAASRARLELASMRYATGDYAGALDILSEERTDGSEREIDTAAFLSALCRRQLGDEEGAAAEFAMITRGEYASWSLIARAEIDERAGRLAAAVDKYESAARSHRNPGAIFKLGECYEQLGEREKAVERYRSLIDGFPRSFEAAKANEKIQLLTAAKARSKEDRRPGESESAAARAREGAAPADEQRSYTIQFGAFQTHANALAVADKLEDILRGVRVERFEHEGRVMHRVRVGIYDNRDSAARDIERAKEQLGLTGTIIPLQ